MLSLRTVLCPVGLTPAAEPQVRMGLDVARAFGARLVIHHNLVELAIGSGVGWMWTAGSPDTRGESGTRAAAHLQALRDAVGDAAVVEARLTRGPLVGTMRAVADAVDADLIVMSTRGAAARDDEDGSVTERMLALADRAVLAVHQGHADHRRLQFTRRSVPQVVLAALDLGPGSPAVLSTALALAQQFGVALHLLHVITGRRRDSRLAIDAQMQMRAALPVDLEARLRLHVDYGAPAAVIATWADQLDAACLVMGEHRDRPFRHWFHPDAPRGVLHRAPCPVWYVPAVAGPVEALIARHPPISAELLW